MESIASFSLKKGAHAYFEYVRNFRRDNDEMLFHFDPGAGFSMIGLNTIAENDDEKTILKSILQKTILEDQVVPYKNPMKTVTKEELTVYPCKKSGVYIGGVRLEYFYFHIVLSDINNPLLGFDYSDDCYYVHNIGGNIEIIGVASNAGERFYPEKVLDFDTILYRFNSSVI